MEDNTSTISLVDLVNVFKKNFVKILIVGIVAALLGGVLGGVLTLTKITYTAELEIYVTPADGSDRLLYDLRSGRFAEQLRLEKNGLPAKEKCNAADYDAAVEALDKFAQIRQDRIDKRDEINRYYTSDIENKYSVLESEYNSILNVLKMYKDAQSDALVNESHLEMIAYYEQKLQEAEEAKQDYYDNYYSKVVENRIQLNTELAELTDQLNDQRESVDEAVEKVLSAWRQDPEVGEQVKLIMNCATYEYHSLSYFEGETEATDKDKESESLHRGYIKITLAVPASAVPDTATDGETFVEELVGRYNNRIGDYVEDYLEEATGVYEAKCTVISPIVNVEREPAGILGEAIKFAAIGAVVGAVLAYCVYVLQLMMKDATAGEEKAVADGAKKE